MNEIFFPLYFVRQLQHAQSPKVNVNIILTTSGKQIHEDTKVKCNFEPVYWLYFDLPRGQHMTCNIFPISIGNVDKV